MDSNRINEMKLALHRWTGAGFRDIKETALKDPNIVFDVLLQNNKHKRYIVATGDEFAKISGGKAEYHKEYQVDGYKGELEGGLDGFVILSVR